MASTRWARRFLSSTRGRVLTLLRRRSRTVNELASELSLTDNAVRVHLATLERDGLVRESGTQRGTRRPHQAFGLTPEAEQLFPKAYAPVLSELLATLGERMGPDELEGTLRTVGARLAAPYAADLTGRDFDTRLQRAVDVMAELGGETEIERDDGRLLIRGFACPLSGVVGENPAACKLAEALLSTLLDAPVAERCEKGPQPRCCFEVQPPAGE